MDHFKVFELNDKDDGTLFNSRCLIIKDLLKVRMKKFCNLTDIKNYC